MCLLYGLNNQIKVDGGEYVMCTREIATYYGKWVSSGPFDIGMATNSALSPLMRSPVPKVAKMSAFR